MILSPKALITMMLGLCSPFTLNATLQDFSLGIRQTEQAMSKLTDQIAENNNDVLKIIGDESLAVLFKAQKSDTASFPNDLSVDTNDLRTALQTGQYATAIQKTAEAIATVWGLFPTPEGQFVKKAADAIDDFAKVYEAQLLLRQNANLANTWWLLDNQVMRMKGLEIANGPALYKAFSRLPPEMTAIDGYFSKWLNTNQIKRSAVLSATMQGVRSGSTAIQIGSGMTDEDIAILAWVPNVNPDFIAAIRRQRDLLSGTIDFAHVEAAAAVDKYTNGSYVNVFGRPQGTLVTVLSGELDHNANQQHTEAPQQTRRGNDPNDLNCHACWALCNGLTRADRPACQANCTQIYGHACPFN
jgi:hypothetical protein